MAHATRRRIVPGNAPSLALNPFGASTVPRFDHLTMNRLCHNVGPRLRRIINRSAPGPRKARAFATLDAMRENIGKRILAACIRAGL